jgi:hypothetical protein
MLAAVEFNYQFTLDATKVGDVFSYWMLPPELCAAYLTVPQPRPQFSFSVGLCPAQTTRKYSLSSWIRLHPGTLTLALSQRARVSTQGAPYVSIEILCPIQRLSPDIFVRFPRPLGEG